MHDDDFAAAGDDLSSSGTLRIYDELEQGSDEWLAARCGMLTASTIGKLISANMPGADAYDCDECSAVSGETCVSLRGGAPIKSPHAGRVAIAAANAATAEPILSVANNETSRGLTETLVAERITGHVDYVHPSFDMQRGTLDEPYARDMYRQHQQVEVVEVGFATNTFNGHTLGASPDGLVGKFGGLEIKSPKAKNHLRTILAGEVPSEYMAQIQASMLVLQRDWWDFCSYSGGWPIYVERVWADPLWQVAIRDALDQFENNAADMIARYKQTVGDAPIAERIDHFAEIELKL